MVKNLPANARDVSDWVRILGWADPLDEGTATHSSILSWRIPYQKSLAGYSLWSRKSQIRLRDYTTTTSTLINSPEPLCSRPVGYKLYVE